MADHRDYIDSFEENKNGLMALKKAMDLGGSFQIQLDNGETITVAAPVAKAVHDVLMEIKAIPRAELSEKMMTSKASFIEVLTVALNTAPLIKEKHKSLYEW